MQKRIASIAVAATSYIGQVRQRNEDIAVIDGQTVRNDSKTVTITLEDEAHFFAVADGVGGAPDGDVASMRVAVEMSRELLAIDEPRRAVKAIERRIRTRAAQVNDMLIRRARQRPRSAGMATTLTAVFVYHGSWWALNCGDSRLYHGSGGQTVQLTRDHTLREFSGDPRIPGNIICNCFGSSKRFFIDIEQIPCAPSSTLLLCSDGLSDIVSAAEIGKSLTSAAPPIDIANGLISLADRYGAHDNVTALVIACQ